MKPWLIGLAGILWVNTLAATPLDMTRRSRMDILQSYAEALYWDGAYQKSVEEYQRLLTEYADLLNPARRADIRLGLARAYAQAGDLEAATAAYRDLLRGELENRQVLLEMARLASQRDGAEKARPYFDRVRTILEGLQAIKALNKEETAALAESYLGCGEPQEAVFQCRRWMGAHDGEDPVILRLYAQGLVESGKKRSAETMLRKLVFLKDSRPSDKVNLAHFLWENGGREEADTLYREVIKRHPHERFVVSRYADDLASVKKFRRAIEVVEAYVKDHPEDLNAQRKLAQFLSWDGEHEESLKLYRRLIYEPKR